MFIFGAKSEFELKLVEPTLVAVARRALVLVRQDFGIYDGNRTEAEQRAHVRSGASKTMASKHRSDIQPNKLARAVDAVPWIAGKYRWEWKPIYVVAEAFRQAAVELNTPIVWGGVWDRRLNNLPAGAEALEAENQAYVQRKRKALIAAGKKPSVFIDGPHYELA